MSKRIQTGESHQLNKGRTNPVMDLGRREIGAISSHNFHNRLFTNEDMIIRRLSSEERDLVRREYVKQEVKYAAEGEKFVKFLDCLQKTAPKVLVFCENEDNVEYLLEYLLIKGVDATAIHGETSQEDRELAISSFKSKKKDVLVTTDVASEGLDFPDIEHVINFDIPAEIENYVPRIGRTGRCGKPGIVTTMVTKDQSKTALLYLKCLLQEAKERIPRELAQLLKRKEASGAKD